MRDIELVVFYIFCYYIGNPISALCWKVPKQTMKLMLENLILSEILSGIKEQKDDICILRSNIGKPPLLSLLLKLLEYSEP